jgi:hypothetical protein
MHSWLTDVANRSDSVHLESIGLSTEDRDMLLVAVSDPESIRDLIALREARSALTNPTLLTNPEHADGQLAGKKPVVLITAGIHATEVGGVQLMPELITRLATSQDKEVRRILDQVVILIVPTLNPDGMDLVHDWYISTLGTSAEGEPPPRLYHQYAGHDNNRDWYTHALVETRNVVEQVHNRWRPHIVLDLHQMGKHAPRYVLPPYIDPAEPHVHPLIVSLTSALGSHIAAQHHRQGHLGVASGVVFDSYSPTRAYAHYHGGVRILAEAASARIASPVIVKPEQMTTQRGFDPSVPGVHNPITWNGGEWRLRDIMDYHLTTIYSLLDHVASHATSWIRDQWTVLADEIRAAPPVEYAITPLKQQIDPRAAIDLVRALQRGDIHVDVVEKSDHPVQKGTIVVRSRQPFGSYARALLDLTPYPVQATIPYDVTSHCVPLHTGVEVEYLRETAELQTRRLVETDLKPFPAPTAREADRSRWLAIDPRSHASVRVVAHALRNGADVRRLLRPHFDAGRLLQAGTWFIAGNHALGGMSRAHQEQVRTWLTGPVSKNTVRQQLPRIGLYIPWKDNAIDGGWLRLMLDHSGLPYETVRDEQIRAGTLAGFDAVLFAHQSPEELLNGNSEDHYPAEFSNGIGSDGAAAVLAYVKQGGTVIAIDGAARALVGPLRLPIRFPLASLPTELYACPGAVVKVLPSQSHPLMLGIEEPFPVMMDGRNAFGMKSSRALPTYAARFAREDLLLSGWMRGTEHLADLGAIISERVGKGHVVGFAFRPQFRTQMLASYAPLINAIMRTGQETT